MKLVLEPAYILHARPFSESSLLAEVWVKSQGRLGLIAKGAKRPKSRMRGMLNPFKEVLISAVGRGELLTLTQIEQQSSAAMPLMGRGLLDGLYLNELLMKLLPKHDIAPELYDIYAATLHQMIENPSASSLSLRWFEYALLRQLGYGFDVEYDDHDKPIEAGLCYDYHANKGLVAVRSYVQPHIKGLTILNFLNHLCDESDLSSLKWLMQKAIASSLSGKTLHSKELVSGMGGEKV